MKKYNKRYVIADIHGELDKLLNVLKLSNFDFENDLLISLGDLSDRGLSSWEVVECLMKIKNFIFIKGNHDFHIRNWLYDASYTNNWYINGGDKTILSYKLNKMKNKAEHLKFYDTAIPYYILDNKCFVHAGFNLNFNIKYHTDEFLCENRDLAKLNYKSTNLLSSKDEFDEIYIGHTPTIWLEDGLMTPIMKNGVINLDTGCGKGGLLTILNIDTKEYFQN